MITGYRDRARGFTLLEIMLALVILAMIGMGVAAGLSAGIRAWESGERNLGMFQRRRIVSERLIREIGGAVNIRGKLEDEETAKMIFNGEQDSLSFLTTAGAMISPGKPLSLKESYIYVDPTAGLVIRESMFSRSDFFNQSRGYEYVLDPTVTDLQFRYYYLPKPSRTDPDQVIEGEWLDSWGPDQIEIEETVDKDDDSRVMEREIKRLLPLAVEVTITAVNTETDVEAQWPSLIVPLKEARAMGFSAKRKQRKK